MTKFEAWDNSYYIVVSKDYEHTHQVQEDDVLYGYEKYCPRMSGEEAWEKFEADIKQGKHFDIYHFEEEYEEFVLFAMINSAEEEEILAYSKGNVLSDALWGYDYKTGVELEAGEVQSLWEEQVQEDEDWYMVTPHWVKLRKVTESDGDKTLIRYINDHTGCVVRSEEWRRKL